MKLASWFGGIALSFVLASSAKAQWLDDFDSYLPGGLAAQSLWDLWTGKTGVDATVTSFRSFTTTNSALVVTGNDVVWDFVNSGGRPQKGLWSMSIKTFIPSGSTGSGWYIVLNQYPTPLKYSVQTQYDMGLGFVIDGGASVPMRFDEWVSLVVSVDLDNNLYYSWYGDQPLAMAVSWSKATGSKIIAVNDLYGDGTGCSGVYFDDDRLDKCVGGPLVLTTKPNPITAGQTLKFYSQSPSLGAGDIGMLFLWDVNGAPYPLGLIPATYDATGSWTYGATVPTGLAGLEIGFRMFAAPAGGKVMLSNEDLVVMR